MAEDGRLVVRDVRGHRSLLNDGLPLDAVLGILHKLVNAVEAESPHVVHGADLDITTAMNVKAII